MHEILAPLEFFSVGLKPDTYEPFFYFSQRGIDWFQKQEIERPNFRVDHPKDYAKIKFFLLIDNQEVAVRLKLLLS